MSNSWFSCKKLIPPTPKNSPQISLISATTLSPNIMVVNQQNTEHYETTLRIRKIRLNPSKKLKQKLRQAVFATRLLYNQCITLCCTLSPPQPATLKNLRSILLNSDSTYWDSNIKTYLEQVPYDIRDGAVRDFVTAYSTQTQLVKEGKRSHFEMKYKRKKDMIQETLVINHKNLKRDNEGHWSCFPKMWDKERLNVFTEKLPDKIEHDCRLIMTKDDKYYLAVPISVNVKSQKPERSVVSLDPGVRIFQTTYDTDGTSYLIGEGDAEKLDKWARIAGKMRDGVKRDWVNGERVFRKAKNKKERRGLRKAAYKIEQKIKDKLSDIQRQTAKFLCEKYDRVIIPEFRTQQMVTKNERRKIGKETSRRMIRWGHYRFRELLKAKGATEGTRVVVGSEEWTSKTCGECGWINEKLRGEKELECEKCKKKVHRDVNGARNIMIINWNK
jgi:transposase